jgi:CheY-like chemotaxis protein
VTRDVLSRLLKREGYRTVSAEDGRQALEKLQKDDVMMPDLDGLELLERLHDHPQWKAVPVVMLTGLSDTHTIHRAEQLGAREYLVKATFSVGEMMNVVKKYTKYTPQ